MSLSSLTLSPDITESWHHFNITDEKSGEFACIHTGGSSEDSCSHVEEPDYNSESSTSPGNVGSGKIYVVSVTVGTAS